MPAGGQRPGLRFAIPHHASHHEIGVVEHRAEGMAEGIAQLTALVNGARRLRRNVTRDATRKRKLFEQSPEARFILGDFGVKLRVGPLKVGIADHRRAAMAGA